MILTNDGPRVRLLCKYGTYAGMVREYEPEVAKVLLESGRAEVPGDEVVEPDPAPTETATVNPPVEKRASRRRRNRK